MLQKLNKYFVYLSVLFMLFGIFSCSTKKNTGLRRAYHNLTCHYNVWWNGDVSLEEGVESLKESVKDNYNKVLPVYNYGTKQEAQSLYPKMDRTIKKASIAIQRHSMSFGGKEYVKWIDDSYLMMGKAHFHKQDYTSARRVFDYVAKEYSDKPIHFESYLWLAKTYIQTERFEKAEAVLNLLSTKEQAGEDLPKNVVKDLPLVYADFFIAQENYDAAYPYLERGLELGNKKYVLTRAEFILGQINQLDGDLETATRYYKKVIKRSPEYKMDFEARINMAQCYDEGSGDSKEINKVLLKMAKGARNKEFLDQIYFALAEVALKDQNDTLAIHYLRKSVSTSKTDNYQKATSALMVADIYFEKADYQLSQAYYDTAVGVLPKDFPNYDQITNKATVLSDLVVYVQTIRDQDSLQRLAAMDTTELYAIIDLVIEDYKIEKERQEELAEEMAEEGAMFIDPNNRGNTNPALGSGGKWYFYNPQAMSFGFSEFKKKWGNRKLEDNWRLTDKRMIMQSYDDEPELDETGNPIVTDSTEVPVARSTDPEEREYYLSDIPRTEAQMIASTEMIIEAYNKLGFLYLEELNDTLNAEATYLEFLNDYPENKYRLQAWYALYKIYRETGDAEKAAYYKNLIVGNYPDSDFAKVIVDPDYFIKLSAQKNLAAKLYEKTYKAYSREQFYRVITYADKGIKQYPEDTTLIPKFMYLRAISIGKVNVPDSMYVAINQLIQEYPSSPVVPMAKGVLRVLQTDYGIGEPVGDDASGGKGGKGKDASTYKYQPNELHLMMMVLISPDIKVDPLKVRISDFKNKYFRLARLRIKSLMLDNQRTLITIGNFDDASEAEDFAETLKNDEYVLSGMESRDFKVVSISLKNYPVFYKDKDINTYLEFYNEYYQNEKK